MQVGPENIAIVLREPLVTGPGLTGTITPLREARLRAELSGTVTRTLVLAGQPVRRGDTLATLDDIAIRERGSRRARGSAWRSRRSTMRSATSTGARSCRPPGAVADRDLESAKRALMIAEAEARRRDVAARARAAAARPDALRSRRSAAW